MLHVIFYPKSKLPGTVADASTVTEVMFESADWLALMPEPDDTSPIEMWSSIQGDPHHIVHSEGTVSHWFGDSCLIAALLDHLHAAPEQYRRFQEAALTYPDDDNYWIVRVESRSTRRVPKTDERYQQQLTEMLDA
jgi:hypothetical protein